MDEDAQCDKQRVTVSLVYGCGRLLDDAHDGLSHRSSSTSISLRFTLCPLCSSSADRLEVEFSSLDSCVKSHESQLKEFVKLEAMLDELDNQPTRP
jgi:hypothetical protein